MTETPEQLRRHATRLMQEGRVEESIDAHERLLALRPDLPDSWYNLAYLQRRARRFEDALASYQQALDSGVSGREEVHLNRAVILSEHLERGEAAEAELRKALDANPRFALAWLNLGNLYEDWGDPAQAREAYEHVLAIDPLNGRALARIAAIDIFQGKAQAVAARLRPLLGNPALQGEHAAEIAFALGAALDATGAYDEAFAAFAAANRTARETAGIRYDAAAAERLIDDLIAAFPHAAAAAAPPQTKPPIFICGMFRSGSTLAEQILGRHSRVTAGGELEILPALVATRLQPYPAAAVSLSPQRLNELRRAYLDELNRLHPAADVVTDKRPDNFLHIGLIKALFPGAKIVHTKRQPFDNMLSIFFLYFDAGISYGFDLADIAHWYAQYLRLMRHWTSLYPGDIHDFDYDAIVSDPRPDIERLLEFCGLKWEDRVLSPDSARTTVRTASVWQVRQPLHARSSSRWKNYEKHLGALR